MTEQSQEAVDRAQGDGFEPLLDYIKINRGFDFTGYKRPSLRRRIAKRMEAVGDRDFAEYQELLTHTPASSSQLFNTILINVTSFFRDAAAWDFLALDDRADDRERTAARRPDQGLVRRAAPRARRPTRSRCCSPRRSARTLPRAREDLRDRRRRRGARDRAPWPLHAGRARGRARPSFASATSSPGDGVDVFRADLRRAVIFGRHDLIQDPPISRVDLLVAATRSCTSCRRRRAGS